MSHVETPGNGTAVAKVPLVGESVGHTRIAGLAAVEGDGCTFEPGGRINSSDGDRGQIDDGRLNLGQNPGGGRR